MNVLDLPAALHGISTQQSLCSSCVAGVELLERARLASDDVAVTWVGTGLNAR